MRANDLRDFNWDDLLARVINKDVIPVIGQDLYLARTKEGKDVLLYRYLTDKLAQFIDLTPRGEKSYTFSEVVLHYLKRSPNDFLGVRRFLSKNLAQIHMAPKGPLWKLARIKPFSLFINTSYDPFLLNALNAVRSYPTIALQHTYQEKCTSYINVKLFNMLENSRHTLLLNIFGSIDKNMRPAYTEKDILETLVGFQRDMEIDPRNPLFLTLKAKSLLFIGCAYDDWLYRFFIRTLSNEPYTTSNNFLSKKFIADDFSAPSNAKLADFLEANDSEVYNGNSENFINNLFERMASDCPESVILDENLPNIPGKVFISYHSDDRPAAQRLASHLREDGVKVWLDKWEMRPGDEVDKTIIKDINKCPVFIPLISEKAKQVQREGDTGVKYHIREWEWAYSRNVSGDNPRLIIPVKIDDTDWMYGPYSGQLYIRIPGGNREEGYENLRARLLEVGRPLNAPLFEDTPVGMEGKGEKAIINYHKSLKIGMNLPLNEVKVLVVGEGGAGKTSLVKRLRGKEFDKNEKKTHGINIDFLDVKDKEYGAELIARIWDFGGQEIMHATHQFFFSKRSFYILVLEERQTKKAEYWLKCIESFGGDSPVLVVLNKIDKNPEFQVNQKHLKRKYKNITGFYRISCKTREGIDIFSSALKDALLQAEILKIPLSRAWLNVKSYLDNMTEPFISYKDYRDRCIAEMIMEESSRSTLLEYLNDLGVIVHYKDFELEDTYVLEPKWVTNAVYKIINSKQLAECKGILELKQLNEILIQSEIDNNFFSQDKNKYIIQLMKKFELCYEIDRERVLIPDLLEREECQFDFNYNKSLKFIFEYDFLPKSVLHRLIVRMHHDIKDELQWRTGAVLEDDDFQTTAVVTADEEEKRIYVYVFGERKRYYFTFLRYTLRDIHRGFGKIEVSERIPVPGEPKATVSYHHLLKMKNLGEKYYFPEGADGKYKIDDLLDGIEEDETNSPTYKGDAYRENGIIDLSEDVQGNTPNAIALNIKKRMTILDDLDALIFDDSTREKEIHNILETNLWILGREYSKISSNETLKKIVEQYLGKKFKGERSKKRPDLLLSQDIDTSYILIELKRPGHTLDIDDETQARKYKLDLKPHISDSQINIMLIGGRIKENILSESKRPDIKFISYKNLISNARNTLKWLIDDLEK